MCRISIVYYRGRNICEDLFKLTISGCGKILLSIKYRGLVLSKYQSEQRNSRATLYIKYIK